MIINKEFTIFLLTHWGILVVFYKYKLDLVITNFANKRGSRFLYELSQCKFCMNHHTALIFVPLLFLFCGFNWEYFIYPFISSSLVNIIKTFNNEND